MRILLLAFVLLSTTAFAEVSRDEAGMMIDQMVKSNMISEEEGQKAKVRLMSMSGQDWSALNQDAAEKANRMPASAPVETSDLNSEQFLAIQNDLKAIAPHSVQTHRELFP